MVFSISGIIYTAMRTIRQYSVVRNILHTTFYISIILLAIVFIIILKQMQNVLRNVELSFDNIQEVRSSLKSIRILLIGMVLFIVLSVAYYIYGLGRIYKE